MVSVPKENCAEACPGPPPVMVPSWGVLGGEGGAAAHKGRLGLPTFLDVEAHAATITIAEPFALGQVHSGLGGIRGVCRLGTALPWRQVGIPEPLREPWNAAWHPGAKGSRPGTPAVVNSPRELIYSEGTWEGKSKGRGTITGFSQAVVGAGTCTAPQRPHVPGRSRSWRFADAGGSPSPSVGETHAVEQVTGF